MTTTQERAELRQMEVLAPHGPWLNGRSAIIVLLDEIDRLTTQVEQYKADAERLTVSWEGTASHWMQKAHESSNALRRLEWLHTIGPGNPDKDGYEWGVFRVKHDKNGKVSECWQTNSDYSDLDAAMKGQP